MSRIIVLIGLILALVVVGAATAGPADAYYYGGGTSSTQECFDGIDNDGDRRIDYYGDPGCMNASGVDNMKELNTDCKDDVDNDGDGYIDYLYKGVYDYWWGTLVKDFDCFSFQDPIEGPNPVCWDLQDNDGDGRTDYPNDPDCVSYWDESEDPPPPAAVTLDEENGNNGHDVDGQSQLSFLPPLPATPINDVYCVVTKAVRFEGAYRLTPLGLDRYRDPTHVYALVTAQCNKPAVAGGITICLQIRRFGGFTNASCISQAVAAPGHRLNFGSDGVMQTTYRFTIPRIPCQPNPIAGVISDWRVNMSFEAGGPTPNGPWFVARSFMLSKVNSEFCFWTL